MEEREESRLGGGRRNLQKHNKNNKLAPNIQLFWHLIDYIANFILRCAALTISLGERRAKEEELRRSQE